MADLVKVTVEIKRFNPEIDQQTGFTTKSLLTVPIRTVLRTASGSFGIGMAA